MNASCLLLLLSMLAQVDATLPTPSFEWGQLTQLPDKQGFAAMFAGVSGNSLVVAGGTNFPRGFPWEGGTKVWYDHIFVLDEPKGTWRIAAEKLPRPLGYGVSVSWNDMVICIGGSDLSRHYADVFSLRLVKGNVLIQPLPSLPQPCANMCGGLVGTRIFVAGGTSSPDATQAMRTFWCLDLSVPPEKMQWEMREPWPGPDRSHAISASLNGEFYLISGFRWQADQQGKPQRLSPFQTDVFRYSPDNAKGGVWRQLADLPRALGAAPTPAMVREPANIYVIGGIDDSVALPDPSTHPGFPQDVYGYDAKTDKWSLVTKMPTGSSRVAVPSAVWGNRYLIVNGERAPGRRSPEIHSIIVR